MLDDQYFVQYGFGGQWFNAHCYDNKEDAFSYINKTKPDFPSLAYRVIKVTKEIVR